VVILYEILKVNDLNTRIIKIAVLGSGIGGFAIAGIGQYARLYV